MRKHRQTLHGYGYDRLLWVVFSPDSQHLAIISEDEIWLPTKEVTSHVSLFKHQDGGDMNVLAFSPDNLLLASASTGKTVWLWDVSTGIREHALGHHRGSATAIVFSTDSHFVAVASSDSSVRLWTARTNTLLHTLLSRGDVATILKFSPDGRN
ncbi:WD40/YVTN repeat-like-containing domain protein [Moelleriella libera RCEF 2490]|uniref:WD40/YVTN repeat-like-containing domain protein n=1 Tax=Moelleriella libera RCEF 2490 TaxID=1081109 RepID=A0A167YCE4_9HYPO|nr:WD40/YVTN repeat-like-containing domain protein [Moelleriella libera RCEF 2490]